MRRLLFILLSFTVTIAVMAAAKGLPSQIRDVVERALANEREAIIRYETFASVAASEGYPGAAALFRAQAQAERTHAGRFEAILKSHNLPVPEERAFTQKTGSTEDNLRAAASAEMTERDSTYREAIETCKQHGATDIAKIFDLTRDSEVEHANLCSTAARNIDSMKQAKAFYVCGKCGYTTDIKLGFCPACSSKAGLERVD